MTTLLDLFQKTVSAHPDRSAVFYGPNKISYQALADQSVALSQTLRSKLGVQPADRVAILLKNCPEYIPCLYGVFRAGAAAVPVNNFLKFPEIEFILRDSGAKALITSDDFKEMLPRFHESLPELKILKVGDLPSVSTLEPFEAAPLTPSSLAVIVYTSGTTGKPKGAMLTQHNLASNVLSCQKLLHANPRDRFTLMLPMFHSFMLTVCIFTPLSMGASIILIRSLQPFKPVLQEFIKRRATILIGIPQIFQAMAHAKIPFWVHWLLNFRLAVSGSAALSMETFKMFSENFRFPLCEGYGLSEAAPVVSFNPIDGVRKPGTVGLPLADVQVKIFDEQDREVPVGEVGELVVRGPNVMLGYWNQKEESEQALRNGWLHTGDLAKVDGDGYFTIVDRKKEMLIVHGMNVYPREIEEIIYKMEGVRGAAVIGKTAPQGELPVAFVEAVEGATLDARTIQKLCKEKLADYKVPREVRIVSNLPRTATGKIAKLELKKQLAV
ncbi:MAG: long-chain fatty acid--CoA ligase [Verrucomicrobiae bacterium]|nr:long-chain fatty acid--CoA ligase [Verrucomicrobiae bacterium]